MSTKTGELALECRRQSEACLYTSTSLFVWLKFLGFAKFVFTVAPLVLGALAGWKLLTEQDLPSIKLSIAIFAFLAGLLPSIYSALKYDEYLQTCRHVAGEFKNLQDGFRRAALVSSKKTFKEFEDEVRVLVERQERARSSSFTAPEWCFRAARKKIDEGDYQFSVDTNAKATDE